MDAEGCCATAARWGFATLTLDEFIVICQPALSTYSSLHTQSTLQTYEKEARVCLRLKAGDDEGGGQWESNVGV